MSTLKHDPAKALGTMGLEPQTQAAGTFDGPWMSRIGHESAKLTGIVGAAEGGPSAQSAIFFLEDATSIAGAGAAAFGAAVPAIIADDLADSVNLDLGGAREFVRGRCTIALTGGTGLPVAAVLTLMGTVSPPTAD